MNSSIHERVAVHFDELVQTCPHCMRLQGINRADQGRKCCCRNRFDVFVPLKSELTHTQDRKSIGSDCSCSYRSPRTALPSCLFELVYATTVCMCATPGCKWLTTNLSKNSLNGANCVTPSCNVVELQGFSRTLLT